MTQLPEDLSTEGGNAAQEGAAAANRLLRRTVDRCLGDGIGREQLAEALVRMAEAVTSEIAEDTGSYRAGFAALDGFDQVPVAHECACGLVYSTEHHYCSRCGSALKPSTVPKAIPGRLQFERRVGKGGAGVVYEAVDLALGRRVAVKTLPTLCSHHDVARLRREAQALAATSHRNLATVYDFSVYRGTPMIVMEYVDGGTLAERIPLPLDVAVEVMLEVTEVVGCLHKAGVVHRDIKPRNIAFTGGGELKLLDFGLARLEREATMSGVPGHVIVGTPAYLSPEAHDHERACPAFDLWALSVTFYETLCGCRPFEAGSPEELASAIRAHRLVPVELRLPLCPSPVRRFFEAAFSPDRAARPRTAAQFAKRLAGLR
jgi:tRNA A-37 threonylcarbamoyl transferase component Bud32